MPAGLRAIKEGVGRRKGSHNADFEATRTGLLELLGRRLLAPDGPGTLVLQPLQHPGTIEENLAKVEAKLAEAK